MDEARLALLVVVLQLSGCGWRGIRPVHQEMDLRDQSYHASVIVFADPIESHSLHHWEPLSSTLYRQPATEYFSCEAIEVRLRVREVLIGPFETGSTLSFYTYRIKGIPSLNTTGPSVFFLTQVGSELAPLTDFGLNAISLAGFPQRPLGVSRRVSGPLPPWPDADRQLVEALLNPRNASDWPKFADSLSRLVKAADSLGQSVLATDRLAILVSSSKADVARAARREFVQRTGICQQLESKSLPQSIRQNPDSVEDRERLFWSLKAFSCSKQKAIRGKAESQLRQAFPDRQTLGCEVCSSASQTSASESKP